VTHQHRSENATQTVTPPMKSQLDSITNWEQRLDAARFSGRHLADACGVCDRQLRRWVQSRKGLPLQQWMRQLRLEKARLLLEAGFSVKEAAAATYYQHRSQFSREFEKRYGVPPSQWTAPLGKCPPQLPESATVTTKSVPVTAAIWCSLKSNAINGSAPQNNRANL